MPVTEQAALASHPEPSTTVSQAKHTPERGWLRQGHLGALWEVPRMFTSVTMLPQPDGPREAETSHLAGNRKKRSSKPWSKHQQTVHAGRSKKSVPSQPPSQPAPLICSSFLTHSSLRALRAWPPADPDGSSTQSCSPTTLALAKRNHTHSQHPSCLPPHQGPPPPRPLSPPSPQPPMVWYTCVCLSSSSLSPPTSKLVEGSGRVFLIKTGATGAASAPAIKSSIARSTGPIPSSQPPPTENFLPGVGAGFAFAK